MGCDIHLKVEKRVGGKWQNVPHVPMETCWSCGGDGVHQTFEWTKQDGKDVRIDTKHPGKACRWCKGKGSHVYGARSYDTFAILANVRNGYGFAGCATGEGYRPISEPRGLPEDADPKTVGEGDEEWLGDHSHSWLVLKELLDYDWKQVAVKYGVVSTAEYLTFKEKGRPESWSGGVSGPGVEHVSPEQMEKLLADGKADRGDKGVFAKPHEPDPLKRLLQKSYYTTVSWEVTYAEAAKIFHDQSIPALVELAKDVGLENVRIVFGFDS